MATRPSRSFGELLRSYRTKACLTQEELAARAGLSARGISDLERGARQNPYRQTVELLASALELDVDERNALFTAANQRRREASGEGRTSSKSQLSPVVGRSEELALLQDLLSGVGPPVVLLAGEPGIGKTRLLREAASHAQQSGWTVLSGSCSRRGGQLLYAPLLEALTNQMHAQSVERLRADLQGCTWLVRLLPELAEQGLLPLPTLQVSPEQERRLMFAAIARYLTTIAGPAGTLLLLDDLHWASIDAFDLLQTLVHAAPLLRVVGAYRNTEIGVQDALNTLVADLAREEMVRQVEVGPLAGDDAATLLRTVLAEGSAHSETLIERILERAGGVPFFLISCARGVQAGALEADEGATVPWDIQQIVRQRIALLSPAARELLGLAAIAGRIVPSEILVVAHTQSEEELIPTLEAICQARLLFEEGDHYQFAHDLIREVVEADLSTLRKRALHRQVAAFWEQRSEQCPAEVLAFHYGQAGELGTALSHLMRAARRAKQIGAHREEAVLLKQAMDFARQTGQHQFALELQMWRGIALGEATLWDEARMELTTVLGKLAEEQEVQRTEVLNTLAEIHHWLLDVPAMRRYAQEALALAEQIGRDDQAARAMSALAQAESSDGETQASLVHVRQALARAGDAHQPRLANGILLAGMLEYWSGHFQHAVASNRLSLELARQTSDTFLMAQTLGNLGLALSGSGRYAEAFEVFEEAQKITQERGTRPWLARTLACRGGVHLDLFDFVGAESLAQEAREVSRSIHWPQSETSAGIDLLMNFARRGEIGRADKLVEEVAPAVALSQGAHGWLWRLRFAAARGELALARGAWEEAASLAEQVILQGHRTGRLKYQARGLEIRARALAALGRVHEAIALLQSAMDLVRPTTDPAMFLRIATVLLNFAGDDLLLREAQARAQTIAQALPNKDLLQHFLNAEPVRSLLPSTS